jgi:glycosyltransferase involved in cell wall biosynthesis
MKVLNIMLSRGLGGVQQSFIDYGKMLKIEQSNVVNISSIFASINNYLDVKYKLPNLGNWDLFSIYLLKSIIKKEKPQAIIVHGGRATKFAIKALSGKKIPVIGVIHSDKLKWVEKCDHIFALTDAMMKKAVAEKIDKSKISLLPNCIDTSNCHIQKKEEFSAPPIIGTMARFVAKKGIDTFLESLSILRREGIQFKAIIGGDGEEANYYKSLAHNLGLEHYVEFVGWVENKANFFNKIDIFFLPSHNEPFGIILLEAMAYNKPIISTSTAGPAEILKDAVDGVLIDIGNATSMAEAIVSLMNNENEANRLAKNTHNKVKEKYDIKIVSKQLINILNKVVK